MTNKLQEHFAIIRDREEVLNEIYSRRDLIEQYQSWEKEQQELFLDYCTGARGVKILYDQYFKLVLDPEKNPERLETILSLILKQKVKILQVLPNESTRIAAEKSLLVLDIVVLLENESIVNVEVQRIGYAFPGQRGACYSADLLMRQYKRVKAKKKKKFRYSDIKNVYTIIFFEKSTAEFQRFRDVYIHRSKQQTDTGLEIELLQEYVFIALDIFKEKLHNKGVVIDNELEAWLTFLCEDDPEWILKLIEVHPEFEELYQEVYKVCRNTEAMMGLFSEELLELDKNTVEYMIDEMQNTIDNMKVEIKKKKELLDSQNKQLDSQKEQLDSQKAQMEQKDRLIEEKDKRIAQLEAQLANK